MARPKKQAHEKRDQRFNLRFTLAEIEHVRLQAAAVGMPPHDYIRRKTLSHTAIFNNASKPDPALINEVNRIGVNVNQLARATHQGRDFVRYWREVGTELQTVMKNLLKPHGS